MQENVNWNLIHRYLSDECTPEERSEVQAWLEEDASHREFLEAIKKVWEVTPGYDVSVDFDAEWRRISHRLGIEVGESSTSSTRSHASGSPQTSSAKQRRDNPLIQLLRVAAIILLIAVPAIYFVSSGSYFVGDSSGAEIAMQKIQTSTGERAKLEFSDGSRVILNAESILRFPKVFEESRREIYLEGEAFFRVTHQDDLPFIVHSDGVAVQVLGTEFNVNAYEDEEGVEVVVKDGKVAVRQNQPAGKSSTPSVASKSNHPAPEVILTGGQRTLVRAGQYPSRPEQVSLAPRLGWVNGDMIFDGSPLEDVIRRLERTYELNFEVADSTLLSRRLKASFRRERPEKVLGLIAFSLEIGYELRGDTVIFKSNQKRSTQ